MPHNLYLHSGLVLSRKINRASPHQVHDAIWYARIESAVALLFSFFINLAVVAVNASKFFAPSCAEAEKGPYACLSESAFLQGGDNGTNPGGGHGDACVVDATQEAGLCGEIGLTTEGYALSSALGPAALYIWALGLFAAGQAATMVCTYAGQIIMGGCLELKIAPWKRVAFTRVFALGPALIVSASTVSHPVLFNNINEYLNILQSVQLPFAMLPVLHFTASKPILGRFRSNTAMMCLSVALALLVIIINVVLVVQFLDGVPVGVVVIACLYAVFYAAVCIRMIIDDLRALAALLVSLCICKPAKREEMQEVRMPAGLVEGSDGIALSDVSDGRLTEGSSGSGDGAAVSPTKSSIVLPSVEDGLSVHPKTLASDI